MEREREREREIHFQNTVGLHGKTLSNHRNVTFELREKHYTLCMKNTESKSNFGERHCLLTASSLVSIQRR